MARLMLSKPYTEWKVICRHVSVVLSVCASIGSLDSVVYDCISSVNVTAINIKVALEHKCCPQRCASDQASMPGETQKGVLLTVLSGYTLPYSTTHIA